jgi:hypothetical protein
MNGQWRSHSFGDEMAVEVNDRQVAEYFDVSSSANKPRKILDLIIE